MLAHQLSPFCATLRAGSAPFPDQRLRHGRHFMLASPPSQAGSSVVERGLYTARVAGSIPVPPTIFLVFFGHVTVRRGAGRPTRERAPSIVVTRSSGSTTAHHGVSRHAARIDRAARRACAAAPGRISSASTACSRGRLPQEPRLFLVESKRSAPAAPGGEHAFQDRAARAQIRIAKTLLLETRDSVGATPSGWRAQRPAVFEALVSHEIMRASAILTIHRMARSCVEW